MASQHRTILARRYPTERYKRLWYPVRPFISIMTACVVFGLSWLGLWTFWPALLITMFFTLDDIVVTPFLSLYKAFNHLYEGRKQFKATVMLIALGLALGLGGVAGWYAWTHIPILAHFAGDFFAALQVSPVLISLSGLLGLSFAQLTQTMSPSLGFGLAVFIAFFIPIQFPLMIEVIFFSMLLSGYVASVITKQLLRGYFKLRYGDSNADGYTILRSAEQQTQFMMQRAKRLEMSQQELVTLTVSCRDKVAEIKKNATLYQEYLGIRTSRSNSYKDIYHGLMCPRLDSQGIEDVKHVLKMSRPLETKMSKADRRMAFRASIIGNFENSRTRDIMHQYELHESGGLDDSALRTVMK